MTNKILPTEQQQEALNVIFNKFLDIKNNTSMSKFTSLAGWAGTGKTTMLSFLADKIQNTELSIHWVCPTGKASSVLRKKLIKSNNLNDRISTCSTIHSLIYIPVFKNKKIIGWKRRPELECDCIIIDEASMVSKELFIDLLRYHLPIICVGDSGQLPAIGENISLVDPADYTLTEIHRQALNSPIIKMSMFIREHSKISRGSYGTNLIKASYVFDPISKKMFDIFIKQYALDIESIILCGMHKTRTRINNRIRQIHEFDSPLPMIGEKLICLKNNAEYGIFNGNLGYVKEILFETTYLIKIRILMDDNISRDLTMFKPVFGMLYYNDFDALITNPEYTNEIKNTDLFEIDEKITIFDFGYTLTVWKAQGSEWDNVLLIEERNHYQTDNDFKKWLYTGVTRASKRLGIIEDF